MAFCFLETGKLREQLDGRWLNQTLKLSKNLQIISKTQDLQYRFVILYIVCGYFSMKTISSKATLAKNTGGPCLQRRSGSPAASNLAGKAFGLADFFRGKQRYIIVDQ